MPEDIIEGANEDLSSSVATDQQTENQEEVIETPAVEEVEKPAEDDSTAQEGVEETGDKPEATDRSPKQLREGYNALEKDLNEKYKPVFAEVEALGGLEVIKALKPIADLALNSDADASQVVSTLKDVLVPQHMEALAWAALDNPTTQEVVLSDPDVQKVIADKFFSGKSLEEVQTILSAFGEEEEQDPQKAELLKFKRETEERTKAAEAQRLQAEAEKRVEDLQKRFYVDTADSVLKRFSLVAPEGAAPEDKTLFEDAVEDIRYAAQGRFLKEHSMDYMQIQDMYAKGFVTQARVAEARLQNMWQATLIKTAERHSKQLQAVSASRKLQQQEKVANTRPDVSGNAPHNEVKTEKPYDLTDSNWLNDFLADFKASAATRG